MAIDESALREKFELIHHSRAELIRRSHVTGRFDGETLWDWEFLIFALPDHPEAPCCYAWEVNGRLKTALGVPPLTSAAVARAAMEEVRIEARKSPLVANTEAVRNHEPGSLA